MGHARPWASSGRIHAPILACFQEAVRCWLLGFRFWAPPTNWVQDLQDFDDPCHTRTVTYRPIYQTDRESFFETVIFFVFLGCDKKLKASSLVIIFSTPIYTAVVRLQAATAPTMSPSPSPAMVTARAEQGTLGALAVPRVTVGKNPFIKSQAGMMILFFQVHFVFVHFLHAAEIYTWYSVNGLQVGVYACPLTCCCDTVRVGNSTGRVVRRRLHTAVFSSILLHGRMLSIHKFEVVLLYTRMFPRTKKV